MAETNLAIEAHKKSIAYAMAGEKEKWLDLFDADGVVHDPVGPSLHDPEGKGARGRAELSAFWDVMIGASKLQLVPHRRTRSGEHAAAVTMTAFIEAQGLKTFVEMVAVYRVNPAGKIVRMEAFWDTAALAEQLKALGVGV